MSVTYKPKRKKRARRLGFLKKMSTHHGRNTIRRRRAHGRKRLTTSS